MLSEEDEYYAFLSMIGALIRLTAQDYKYGRKEEVEEFLSSDWFLELCSHLRLDSKVVKDHIRTSKVKQRSEYN